MTSKTACYMFEHMDCPGNDFYRSEYIQHQRVIYSASSMRLFRLRMNLTAIIRHTEYSRFRMFQRCPTDKSEFYQKYRFLPSGMECKFIERKTHFIFGNNEYHVDNILCIHSDNVLVSIEYNETM